MSENIDEFNRLTISILDALYATFPTQSILRASEFFENPTYRDKDALLGTMKFLESEGFFRYSSSAGDGDIFMGLQLSMKGLEVLNRTPAVVHGGASVADKIKSFIKIGTKEAYKEGIKLILSSAIN
ncbi:MAG: hypothetical protein KF685_08205 [Acidobacteria bacterium]|nr:hypothetical protein [Acidobacteriota bacterium]